MYAAIAVQGGLLLVLTYALVWGTGRLAPVWMGLLILTNVVTITITVRETRHNRSALRTIREANYLCCPECSYDLSANPTSGICPECGATYSPLSLRERWEHAYQKQLGEPRSE